MTSNTSILNESMRSDAYVNVLQHKLFATVEIAWGFYQSIFVKIMQVDKEKYMYIYIHISGMELTLKKSLISALFLNDFPKEKVIQFVCIYIPGSRNRAARQRALQIIYRPCRLISHLKREKKFFSFSVCDKHSYFCTPAKQY